MERNAQQIVEMYAYKGPENTIEDQIVDIEETVSKRAFIRAITIGFLGVRSILGLDGTRR